ncbi:MAG: AAA family ATPase [Candidatus Eremiobacteraeota bacterium]|nr:AAA family ATPase [Candidatus Eremiobacteraeota bacterium]
MITRPVVCGPFIGRIEELAYLRERKREAAVSHGGLVFVAGEAGVGKSRLIAEFCSSIRNSRWRLGVGACLEVASRPYGPILDALDRLGSPITLGIAQTKREQFDAIVEHFATLAARRAIVIVLEDLQWADAATLDLLAYLGAKLSRLRILAIASFRTDDLHPSHPALSALAKIARNTRAGRIDIAPLQGVELQRFIDEALGDIALPDEIRRAVAQNGDGNPFFTEELLKSAVEALTTPRANTSRTVPQTVRDTLLARLLPLDDAERQVIAQAAVIGRSFGLDLLAATLGIEPEPLLRALGRARDFQLIDEVGRGEFRFRHALTRDVIYGGFLGAQTRLRHHAIAVELEKAPESLRSLEALAFHWWAAGESAPAASYNEQAGDSAASVHAHEDAIAFYERALESENIAHRTRGLIVEKIASAQLVLTSTAQAHATYEKAANIFRDGNEADLEARCRVRGAMTAYTLGISNPTAPLQDMLSRLEADEYVARSRIHLGLAWLTATLWFPTEAEHHLQQVDARALSEVAEFRLYFHNISAWVAMTFGQTDRFRREYAAWVAAAQSTGSALTLAGAHYNGALCFSFFGLHDEAVGQIDRALRIARESRSRHAEECALSNAALCYLSTGDLSRARACVEAISTTTENNVSLKFASALGCMIGLYLDDEDLIQKWFDAFEAAFSRAPDIDTGAAFAQVMARRGRLRDAETILHRAIPAGELIRGNVVPLLTVGRYGAPADRKRAREYLARAAAGTAELPERPALALFDAMTSLQDGRVAQAAALGNQAAEGFRRLRFPLLEAAALETAGNFEGALAIFRRCGAVRDVRRLERTTPAENGASPGTMPATTILSARELEIATLAGDGRANREIARSLSITEKTVEKHLASIYQKLGIGSRRDLGSRLSRLTSSG